MTVNLNLIVSWMKDYISILKTYLTMMPSKTGFGIDFSLAVLSFAIGACTLVLCQDEAGARWMPSQHHSKGRGGAQVRYLILHGTAGGSSAAGVGSWFQNPQAQASTHYIVDQKGVVVQSVREGDTAWANGRIETGADPWWRPNPNSVTISIEHVKSSTDNSNELTPAQKQASFKLINNILARNPGIKRGRADASGGITGHYSISPQSRARCPGPYPWDEMFAAIGGSSEGGTSSCSGTVTADALNVRAEPNSKSQRVGMLSNGQRVTFTGRVNGENVSGNSGWFKTSQGYVSAYYISLNGGGPSWCRK